VESIQRQKKIGGSDGKEGRESVMKHWISYDEWLGYLDGELDPAAAARVKDHIDICGECHTTWEDLLTATAALRAAANEFAVASVIGADAVSQGRERVLARIRATSTQAALSAVEAVAVGELTVGRLRRLQRVVAPACGAHTAFRLIVAAVGRTSTPHGAAAWRCFMENLTDLTSALCGRSMARLVWEIGNSLP
jgi:predicted anti-sigma-YlaC factor YlaD